MGFDKKLIVFFPVIAGILWGSGGIFVRAFNDFGFHTLSIFVSRVIPATILLFIMLLICDKKSLKIDIKDIWVFIGTGLIATLPSSVFYNESLLNVSLSLAALLLGLSPVFALIISVVLFKEKLTSRKIFCLVIALIGCLFVSGVLETSGFKWSGWGIIAGLLSALTWAIYGVFSKIAIKKNYSTLTILFYNFFICSVFLIPFTQWDLFITYTATNTLENIILGIVFYAIITIVLPYFLFNYALKYMDNGEATILYGGAEPIAATIFGALIFAEYPSILNMIGIIITILSLSLLVKSNEI